MKNKQIEVPSFITDANSDLYDIKDSYIDDINRWDAAYNKYKENISLKSLKNYNYKQIREALMHKYDEYGNVIISSRHKIFDLNAYHNDPDYYYFDVMNMIRAVRYDVENPNGYCDFVYCTGERSRMSCIHFLFNMIIWYPLFVLGVKISPDYAFRPKTFTNDEFKKYVDSNIIDRFKHLTTFNEMSFMVSRIYDLYILMCEKNSIYLGLSFSLYDIYKRWPENEELYNLNHTKIDDDMSSLDGEQYLDEKANRFTKIMMNEEPNNCVAPLLESGVINKKQLSEYMINIGYKPTLQGQTLNTHPKSSFISQGLRNPVDYVTDASGGRKASILALEIDNSGYMLRTLCKSASSVTICKDPDYDCGTKHYFIKEIKSKSDLDDMVGRWYLDDDNHLKQVSSKNMNLIGRTLKFRSPATCASKKGICRYCYGNLYNQNLDVNIGINSAIKLLERFYQNTMSAKHILSTKTTTYDFSDNFYNFFRIEDGYRIMFNEEFDYVENYEIKVNINEICRDKQIENLNKNEYVKGFVVYNKEENTEERFDDNNGNPIYFSDDLFAILVDKRKHNVYDEEGWISIPMDKLNPESDIFFMQFTNAEITKPLSELRSLIEKGSEIDDQISTISELIERVDNLFKQGKIRSKTVHVEVMCRNLIRDRNDPTKQPDYTQDKIDPMFMSIHGSILNSDSIIDSLSFERIAQQMHNPLTYQKTGVSAIDELFLP